jgi:hypothetical protein
MQRYSFRVTEGKYSDSGLAVDLPDKLAARKEALAMCIDLVPSVLRGMQTDTNWQLEVTDQTGKQGLFGVGGVVPGLAAGVDKNFSLQSCSAFAMRLSRSSIAAI